MHPAAQEEEEVEVEEEEVLAEREIGIPVMPVAANVMIVAKVNY